MSSSGSSEASASSARASSSSTSPPLVAELAARFAAVRKRTVELCAPLTLEDQLVQPMADASPSKWHLAHTTWFFESFVLGVGAEGQTGQAGEKAKPFDPSFAFLFNSYYEAVGPRVERARRGMLSRPGLERVHAYRAAIDRQVLRALAERELDAAALERLELGLHHEQQHQELILTDIKYVLGTQPLRPAYRELQPVARGGTGAPSLEPSLEPSLAPSLATSVEPASAGRPARGWRSFDGGIYELGASPLGFAFDNERPRHRVLLRPFRIATRPVTNGDVLAFLAAGGYRDPQWWLSDGWQAVVREGWRAPLYWELPEDERGALRLYELGGVREIDPDEPACHLSYYEADALARWAGARLPTEQEWEVAAVQSGASAQHGNFADDDRLHPRAAPTPRPPAEEPLQQLFGDVWEWTSSSYAPYPGFRPLAGALGEYNGKFMSGQQVLRGGSCFSPRGHVRASYRNFFPPAARWQMTGVRLAADLDGTLAWRP